MENTKLCNLMLISPGSTDRGGSDGEVVRVAVPVSHVTDGNMYIRYVQNIRCTNIVCVCAVILYNLYSRGERGRLTIYWPY